MHHFISSIHTHARAQIYRFSKRVSIQSKSSSESEIAYELCSFHLPFRLYVNHSLILSLSSPLRSQLQHIHTHNRYPILGGIFFNSGIVVQGCIIPLFFILRASYEYGADAMTSKSFGSDGMPVICLLGVGMHEICLTLMMTSISHPLIFGMLSHNTV